MQQELFIFNQPLKNPSCAGSNTHLQNKQFDTISIMNTYDISTDYLAEDMDIK